MPTALVSLITSRPIEPMPTTPTVCPSRSSKRCGAHSWAAWARNNRGRSRLRARRYISTVRAIGAAAAPDDDVTRTPRSSRPVNTG